jgi:alpha-galactosidase
MAFYLRSSTTARTSLPPPRSGSPGGTACPDWNRVRYDLFRRFGHFVTESSEHFAEYVPWYIKRARPDLIERPERAARRVPRALPRLRGRLGLHRGELDAPGSVDPADLRAALDAAAIPVMPGSVDHAVRDFEGLHRVERSIEYGATIVRSLVTGAPSVVYGNVPNRGLLPDLPEGCCVEVPCLVDGQGVQPTHVGPLPPQLAALMRTNVNVQQLVVAALVEGRRDHLVHAALLDPRTAMELAPDEIEALVDELLAAHGDLIPEALRA